MIIFIITLYLLHLQGTLTAADGVRGDALHAIVIDQVVRVRLSTADRVKVVPQIVSAAKLQVVIIGGRIQRRCRSVSIIRLGINIVSGITAVVGQESAVRGKRNRLKGDRFD